MREFSFKLLSAFTLTFNSFVWIWKSSILISQQIFGWIELSCPTLMSPSGVCDNSAGPTGHENSILGYWQGSKD